MKLLLIFAVALSTFANPPINGGGYFDGASCTELQGWAVDFGATKLALTVEIYVGSKVVATALASQPRPDVGLILGVGNNHGFVVPTPKELLNAGEVTVGARIKDGPVLSNSPRKLKCGDIPVIPPPVVEPKPTPPPPQPSGDITAILRVVRADDRTLTIGACTADAPCNVRFGSRVFSISQPVRIELAAGNATGEASIFVSPLGLIVVGHNLPVAFGCIGCTVESGANSFPSDSIPLARWSVINGKWNPTGQDFRAFIGRN